LAVHGLRQNMGIGLALMQVSLAAAKLAGHGLILLVGDEPYYARVGFQRLPHNDILLPGPYNLQRFLYLELRAGALAGVRGLVLPPWRYAEISAALAIPHQAGETQQ
jgi:predicted N-acetyltransferase YhbS